MFRPGRNPKDSTHTTDDTADHTPHTSTSGHGSPPPPAPTATEAYQQSVHTQTTTRAVTGDITASKRIEMGRVAKVTGNIQTPALIIENGALFEGSCRMVQSKDQLDKQPGADRGAATASASTSAASTAANASSS